MKGAHGWMAALLTGLAGVCAVTIGCQVDGEDEVIEVDREEEVFGDYEPYEEREPMMGEQEPMMEREPIQQDGYRQAPARPGDTQRIQGDPDPFDEDGDDPFSGTPPLPGSR